MKRNPKSARDINVRNNRTLENLESARDTNVTVELKRILKVREILT